MNLLGPLAKGMAFLMGKQPEDQLHPRGFLGIELAEAPADRSTGCGSAACWPARPPPGPGSRPATLVAPVDREVTSSRRRASPSPRSGRATASRWSSAAAQVPARERRIIISRGGP